jgi:predicted PurR-regulated permease PerM
MAATDEHLDRRPVPWRTIWATIFSVLLTLAGLVAVQKLNHVIAYLVVALFFTVVLTPPVDLLTRRAHIRRGLSTTLVYFTGLALFSGLMYAFIRPIVDQSNQFADQLPQYVDDAQKGKGPVGELVKKYKLDKYVKDHQADLRKWVSNLGTPAFGVVKKIFTTLFAAVTVLVLTFLMLLETPKLTAGVLTVLPRVHRERVQRVAGDAAQAVSGYVFGNVLISMIAGVSTWIVLAILGVPYAGVLGLWVGFADLIPLIGATLGAVPTALIAFLHSVPAGVTVVIFFVAYQQLENHVLQTAIMSKTVNVNPLGVLVSVLIGVQLFGLLGALLAIPGAGVVQVVARDLWDSRSGRLKDEPTIGADEVPIAATTEPEG